MLKRFAITLACAGTLFCLTAAPSHAAYLYLQECREAAHGVTGDNEVRQGWNRALSFGFTPDHWNWSSYTRQSDNRIIQWVKYTAFNGAVLQYRIFCYDDNKSGQIAVSEDWLG